MNDRRKKTYYGPNDDSCHLGRVVHKVAHLWPQVVLPALYLLSWDSALMAFGSWEERGERGEHHCCWWWWCGEVVVVRWDGGIVKGGYGWCWCDMMFNIHHVMCWGWAENDLWVNNYNTDEKSPFLGWKFNICNPDVWRLSSHSDWK